MDIIDETNINKLLCSANMNAIIKQIISKSDKRLALNINVINEIRTFLTNVIEAFILFNDIQDDLLNIKDDYTSFFNDKILKLCGKSSAKSVAKFIIGTGIFNLQYHGSTTNWQDAFNGKSNNHYCPYDKLKTINTIYESYGLYKPFESKLLEEENDDFFLTNSLRTCIFYAYQSPEYFARFASRSDYYKLDPYYYDRLAWYRKDYKSCLKNLKQEFKQYGFSANDSKIVLQDFLCIWQFVLANTGKPAVYVTHSDADVNFANLQLDDTLTPYQVLQKLKTKTNTIVKFSDYVKQDKIIINLPDVSKILKRQHPLLNKKFILINNKKSYPDFYTLGQFCNKNYLSFGSQDGCDKISLDICNIPTDMQVQIVNEYYPNSKKAKDLYRQLKSKVSLNNVIEYYKQQFNDCLLKLTHEKDIIAKVNIINQISTGCGLRYIVSRHYQNYFKDCNRALIYQYHKLMGNALTRDKANLTNENINKQIQFYNKCLTDADTIISANYPVQLVRGTIKI